MPPGADPDQEKEDVVTTPGTNPHDSDPDPTGIRSLLASLPDPGPMPEELVERITTSLREEQRRREAVPAATAEDRGRVVSLEEERQRRRPTRVLSALGAAAAVAVAATVATSQLFGGGTSAEHPASAQYGQDISDSAGAEGGAQDDAAATEEENQAPGLAGGDGEQEGAEAGGADAGGDGQHVFDAVPDVVVVPGSVALTRAAFVEQLRQELETWQAGPAAEAPSSGLSAEDAATCSRSVPDALQPRTELHVSAGTLDGDEMVVLVQTAPGPATAWVLPSACARGPAELLHGPVVVD
jgi:hypothetical protein